jgi:prolyl oligopeptidase
MKYFLSVLLFSPLLVISQLKYPVTVKKPVVDDYFGHKVEDPYRWLEDDRSAPAEAWVKEQNIFTEKYLGQIPGREKIRTRLTDLWNYNKQSAPFKKGNSFFCFKNTGLQNQSVLYVMKSIDDRGEILLDPNSLSNDGTVALAGISVSNDGKIVAYALSRAGSDWVEIHFREVTGKKDLPDVIRWVKFSGMSWKGDGIYYARYPKPSGNGLTEKNRFHKVCYHRLGTTQDNDQVIFEDKDHPDYNFGATVTADERYLFISISESTSGEKLLLKDLADSAKPYITISPTFDFEFRFVDNIGSTFYMVTNQGAPNYRLVGFTPETAAINAWKTIVPQGNALLEGARICNGKLLVSYLENVSSKLYCYTLDGTLEKKIGLPGLCRINSIYTEKKYDFATYSVAQFTSPEQCYYLDARTWQSRMIFKPDCKFASENYITDQVFYESKDGTVIPMFITHKKGMVKNPATPCFVYGYGGFNISIAPEFRPDRAIILEAGGIYCVPNIRGGGEYGEEWHKQGTRCQKQNVFDDFMAACDYLVANNYTSHNKLAIHGRSNGGLLVGAVITQRPDICKVAVPAVGVMDMLRYHRFTIGRAWTVDYGSSDVQDEFNCLIKYSPLHNVKPAAYPATLILTGDHDDRVVPAHSFKFAATLQEKNTGTNPTLVRIDVNAGHGAGKPTAKQINEFTDMWAFILYNLGVSF